MTTKYAAILLILPVACSLEQGSNFSDEHADDQILPDASSIDAQAEEPEDPWALAKDVNLPNLHFDETTPIPENYTRQSFSFPGLSGPEWFQGWFGGVTQSFNWNNGTDFGKRCGQAAAIRLEAIVNYVDESGGTPGIDAFNRLREESPWAGTMWSWVADFSEDGSRAIRFHQGGLYAWRNTGYKWGTAVRPDGSCGLPTLETLERFTEECLQRANVQGCQRLNNIPAPN